LGTSGSARGAVRKGRPYRDRQELRGDRCDRAETPRGVIPGGAPLGRLTALRIDGPGAPGPQPIPRPIGPAPDLGFGPVAKRHEITRAGPRRRLE